MRLTSMVIAIAAAAAGCYSPSYSDCQVGCADGVCPSGLTCDPALTVCRPAGSTGDCPPATDDALVVRRDIGEQDGDANPSFCASVPGTPLLCHDFDTGALEDQGWDSSSVQGTGMIALVASDRSPPIALESLLPGDAAGGMIAGAQLIDGFVPPPTFASFRIAFDLKIVERISVAQPQIAFRVTSGTSFAFDVVSETVDSNYVVLQTVPGAQASEAVGPGTWLHYEIRVTKMNNQFQVSVFREGLPYPGRPNGVIGSIQQSNVPMWNIHVGALGSSSPSDLRFHYDNIVVTSQ